MNLQFRSFLLPVAAAALLCASCAQEVSHTESDKPNLFGGETHKETTVYKNPDGTTATEHQEESTR